MAERARLAGIGASEGVAVGPVFVHRPGELKPERETIPEGSADAELERFREAVAVVVERLSETADQLRDSGAESEAGIFEAHAEMAKDEDLHEGVEERVR